MPRVHLLNTTAGKAHDHLSPQTPFWMCERVLVLRISVYQGCTRRWHQCRGRRRGAKPEISLPLMLVLTFMVGGFVPAPVWGNFDLSPSTAAIGPPVLPLLLFFIICSQSLWREGTTATIAGRFRIGTLCVVCRV